MPRHTPSQHTMTSPHAIRARRFSRASSSRRSLIGTSLALMTLLSLAAPMRSFAQEAASTGTISGRVFNPITGSYVSNAEVLIEGTNLTAITTQGGYFTILNAPTGAQNLKVYYTGYDAKPLSVNVESGKTADCELNLAASADTLVMDALVVSSEKEGNAKALSEQRHSMNITTTVSSDVFGDIAEGNVGEFLKNIPGVDLEYVEADTRAPKIRGLPPQYTGVTMNGMKMASADAFVQYNATDNAPAGSSNRSMGFEQLSINNIESIEVSFTNSADKDPNSPAGTIDMRTKRAFDRKGRFVAWQANVMGNSEDFSVRKNYGPSDSQSFKLRPGGVFEYSDVYAGGRLGAILTLSESNMYNQQRQTTFGYDSTPTATDPRPFVITGLSFKSGPKFTERSSASLTLDYKVSNRLSVSLMSNYNFYLGQYYNRQFTLGAVSRANVTGDGLTSFDVIGAGATLGAAGGTNPGSGGSNTAGASAVKIGRTKTLSPSFEYRGDRLNIRGAFMFSDSISSYGAFTRGVTRDTLYNQVKGVTYHFERSSLQDWDIRMNQTGGPDWGNLASYTNPRIMDDGRYGREQVYQGRLDLKYILPFKAIPTWVKVGGKVTELYHFYDNTTPVRTYSYIGPGGNTPTTTTGSFSGFQTKTVFDMGDGTSFKSLSGAAPAFVDRNRMAELFLAHPEYFLNTVTAQNYYDAYVSNHKSVREEFDAAYAMLNSSWGRYTLQAGVRLERTVTDSKEFDPKTPREVLAAGYALDSSKQKASTIAGLQYQYFTNPQVHRVGSYTDAFPSIEGKVELIKNLLFQVGYSKTISRPNYNDLSGVWNINDDTQTVNMPNPTLKPAYSDNFSSKLSYYFGNAGSLSIGAFENDTKNAVIGRSFSAEEMGYGDDPDWSQYTFNTRSNGAGTQRNRSYMADFRQTLTFLPRVLKSLTVFANYTRNTVRAASVNATTGLPLTEAAYQSAWAGSATGVSPHSIGGGLGWSYRRFAISVNGKWTADTPFMWSVGRFRRHRLMTDLNTSLALGKGMSLFMQVRNITNEPDFIYQDNNPGKLYRIEHYGAIYTFGVKGRF